MQVLKLDHERQRVFGIALVGNKADHQGDYVTDADLEDAAFRAVANGCVVKVDHAGEPVGRLLCSFPLTEEIAKALGIARPNGQSAWLVGLQVDDATAWAAVRSGEVGHALSIGGRAMRITR